MSVYDSALHSQEDIAEQEKGFEDILDAMIAPALEMCEQMMRLKKNSNTWDMAIFMINCIVYLQVSRVLIVAGVIS